MARPAVRILLRITVALIIVVLLGAGGALWWVTQNYRQVIMKKLPQAVLNATDSIYHISIEDISIDFSGGAATLTGVKLWPDLEQAKRMRAARRKIPPTLSTVYIPRAGISGIAWRTLWSSHTFSCRKVVVQQIKWLLSCTPRPGDSLFAHGQHSEPWLQRIEAADVSLTEPDVSYVFHGEKGEFSCYMQGGRADLSGWAYNSDQNKDTSVLLYARNGTLRFKEFTFLKPTSRYTVSRPLAAFRSSGNSVTLTNIVLKDMKNTDLETGKVKEIYNLNFPSIALGGFNWNKLIKNTLQVYTVDVADMLIDLRFIRGNAAPGARRAGSFPHQLLLQVGMDIIVGRVNIDKSHLRYTEVTPKGAEAVINFTDIKGTLANVTNVDSIIAVHNSCKIKLEGKFNQKTDVGATFNLHLADTKGKFSMDGYCKDLDGDDVIKQARAFTFVEVTSFHLNRMDMHIDGDETNLEGKYTSLYRDLKISLFKFKSNARKGKKGPFSFLGSALVLYPANPMPGKEVRTETVSLARDPEKGFIALIWENIFRAARKTAVRTDELLTITDGKEDGNKAKENKRKKPGLLKRLFGSGKENSK